jgi:FtsP/CotA-like multicopper oxidase with cupredoxin domain
MKNKRMLFLLIGCIVAIGALFLYVSDDKSTEIQLEIKESLWELRPGLTTKVWTYGGTVPGMPIVVKQGESIRIKGTNNLPTATNIHWHGLLVPNDQDGPGKTIKPGKQFSYKFTVNEAGTYWYHSHFRPVLDQVDNGLYAPFIVKAPEDALYSEDHVLVLDDWYLDDSGDRLAGTARGEMERFGNIETVNGKTGDAIQPLYFQKGELHKLRFINASTAAVHTLKIAGHRFRITHTDGRPLVAPYETDTITLSPGERIDAEVSAVGEAQGTYVVASDRSELGIKIPIIYQSSIVQPVASPFVPPTSKALWVAESKNPDFVLELNSVMEMSHGTTQQTGHGSMGHGDANASNSVNSMQGMMRWTINGKSYPETEQLNVKLGQVVKIRLVNKDVSTAEKMDHPIHIHGTEFQVVSLNGKKPDREIWKDTINVPAGESVDLAFIMTKPGTWMVHCHILDHEDGGMMTAFVAK